MWGIIKSYLWPFSLSGVEDISPEGEKRLKMMAQGKQDDLSRSYFEAQADEKIRKKNRQRLSPYLHIYVRRWLAITVLFIGIALLSSRYAWLVFEIIFTLAGLASAFIFLLIFWIYRNRNRESE